MTESNDKDIHTCLPHPQAKYGREVIEIIMSLADALQKSGGQLNLRTLRQLSTENLLLMLAANRIEFRYVGGPPTP